MGQIRERSPSAKTIGVTGEQLFSFRALEEGLLPAVPIGDNCQYDFLVDNGQRISRVQVKSSSHRQTGRNQGRYDFFLKHSKQNKVYSAEQLDFFALIAIPHRTIYIVPYEALAKLTKVGVYPTTKNTRSKMEPYREAWCLL